MLFVSRPVKVEFHGSNFTAHAINRPWIVRIFISSCRVMLRKETNFLLLSELSFDKDTVFYLFIASQMLYCFILQFRVQNPLYPEGFCFIRRLKSGPFWLCRPIGCRHADQTPSSLSYSDSLEAVRLCQLSQECLRQPRRGHNLMLLFHGPAKPHIGRPCFIILPPCLWPWLNWQCFSLNPKLIFGPVQNSTNSWRVLYFKGSHQGHWVLCLIFSHSGWSNVCAS